MKVLDKGELILDKSCVEDLDVVNAARVSLNAESAEFSESDKGLIRYLMNNRHGTPFEHGFFKFKVKLPLFVVREWHRHRIGHSYNEWSGRYSILEPEFYIPEIGDTVTQIGKPGKYQYDALDSVQATIYRAKLQSSSEKAYENYLDALERGVSKQQARLFLPVNIYTKMIWSCNPRSLMHFLGLRNEENAQFEIREYAKAAEEVFKQLMPVTSSIFIDGGRVAP